MVETKWSKLMSGKSEYMSEKKAEEMMVVGEERPEIGDGGGMRVGSGARVWRWNNIWNVKRGTSEEYMDRVSSQDRVGVNQGSIAG